MKFFLILALLLTTVVAKERPKIALVLSGGGARGGAHVGVLKVLEAHNIPIDLIVGTSMGSFVGGLYASGKTPQEIDTLLTTTDWTKYIRTDFNRAETPMRKKEIEYLYQGRLGLGVNSNNELVLPTGVFKRQPMLFKFLKETQHVQNIKNFDNLPIPYRAVATDIKNGDAVILKSGSLAKAIYASSSIPGGFQPINIDGVDLVDGGVSDNIPIAIAKEMGADIIIAVDVSENFNKNLDVNSYFVVMGQLINILMRKNANESISTLSEKDILLTPNLKGFTGLDADKYVPIIQAGVEVTQKAYEKRLKAFSLSDEEYAKYKKRHRRKVTNKVVIIDAIEVYNQTYISNESILDRLHAHVGEKLDEDLLRKDLLHMYDMMIFDSIEYDVKQKNGQNILCIKTTPSWDNHGEIRFSIGLQDDFQGHSAYSLKLGYTMFGLNEYGGEWKSDLEIGLKKRAYTELFQPFDSMQRYYVKPYIEYTELTDLIPIYRYIPGILGSRELVTTRYGAGLAFGMHITTNYEFEVRSSAYRDTLLMDSISYDKKYEARPIYLSFKSDSLDNLHFPKTGFKSELLWTKEMYNWGSDYDYEQIYLEVEKPFTFYSNNLTAIFKYGSTYKKDGLTSLAGSYTLGGLFNLSGYAPYSLNDDNMVLGVIKYRYEIKDGGFFGSINAPLFAGFSLEAGDTWGDIDKFSSHDIKKSGTVYVAADTFLGPFYFAFGISSEGENSAYLYLGEKF
jgi:NTE family protein